jgi:hypothetical protein
MAYWTSTLTRASKLDIGRRQYLVKLVVEQDRAVTIGFKVHANVKFPVRCRVHSART